MGLYYVLDPSEKLKGAITLKEFITHEDLRVLKQGSYAESLLKFVHNLFLGLCEESNGDEHYLRRNPIYLCEEGDSLPQKLAEAPFGPDYVERIELAGQSLFRVGLQLDNDSLVQYLIPIGTLDEETECWLDEHVENGSVRR